MLRQPPEHQLLLHNTEELFLPPQSCLLPQIMQSDWFSDTPVPQQWANSGGLGQSAGWRKAAASERFSNRGLGLERRSHNLLLTNKNSTNPRSQRPLSSATHLNSDTNDSMPGNYGCSLSTRPMSATTVLNLGENHFDSILGGGSAGPPQFQRRPASIPGDVTNLWRDYSKPLPVAGVLGQGGGRKLRSFIKAREFARGLKLADGDAWVRWCSESSHKPDDIPSDPSAGHPRNSLSPDTS